MKLEKGKTYLVRKKPPSWGTRHIPWEQDIKEIRVLQISGLYIKVRWNYAEHWGEAEWLNSEDLGYDILTEVNEGD